jgi:hypothetical protein
VNDNQLKAAIGLVLFATWVGLVIAKTPNAGDLISVCKEGLLGLGLYHIGDAAGQRRAAVQFPASNQPQGE